MTGVRVRIRDCELVQAEWLRQSAVAAGGKIFSTHNINWAWNPEEQSLYALFPASAEGSGLRPALAEAVRLGVKTVGIWANAAVRLPQALQLGFEAGWQPWWMAASVFEIPLDESPLTTHHGLNLAKGAWQAQIDLDGGWAASGTLFAPQLGVSSDVVRSGLGGIFNMYVAQEHQRQGLGTRVLRALAARAQQESLDALVLNSTPAGERLYRSNGFELIGRGQTYWLHLG